MPSPPGYISNLPKSLLPSLFCFSRHTPASRTPTPTPIPYQDYLPVFPLICSACLLFAAQIFFLASPSLPIKTMVFLTGRAAFQICGTQGGQFGTQEVSNPGTVGERRTGSPPPRWSTPKKLRGLAHHSPTESLLQGGQYLFLII